MCNDSGMLYKSKFKAVKGSFVSTKYAVENSVAFLPQQKNPLSRKKKKKTNQTKKSRIKRKHRRYTFSVQTDKFAC